MLEPNKIGWIEREELALGPLDARLRPIAVMPCTTDVHSVWEGLVSSLDKPLILGHEGVGEIIEVGSGVKDKEYGTDRGNCSGRESGGVLVEVKVFSLNHLEQILQQEENR